MSEGQITIRRTSRHLGGCNLCPYNEQPDEVWSLDFRVVFTGGSHGQQVRLCDAHLGTLAAAIAKAKGEANE